MATFAVHLKIFQKPHENLQIILENLNYWLEVFSDPKYCITIYNENVSLPNEFSRHKIIDRQHLRDQSVECKKLEEQIVKSFILSARWKNAASALSFPYWFHQEELIWNIDASDLQAGTNETNYIQQAENYLLDHNLPMFNQDIYLLPNYQFSFGVHLSRTSEMKKIIETV